MYQGMACSAATVTLWPVPTCMSGWPASQHPQESPGSLGSAHNTLSVWKTHLGTFPLTGYDQQFGSCFLCRPTANIRNNRREIVVKLVHTSISVCNFQSNCVRARNTDVFESPIWNVFWWTVGRSVATPVPVSCYDIRFCTVDSAPWRTNLQPRDSVVVNRRTANAKTRHWRPGRTHCTHQDVKIHEY